MVTSCFKKCLGIVKTYVLNHIAQMFNVFRIRTMLYHLAYHLTQDTSVVLVPHEGGETSGICQHSDRSCQGSCLHKVGDLIADTAVSVIEPPGCSVLYIRCKVICKSRQCLIVGWIEVVHYGFAQAPLFLKS